MKRDDSDFFSAVPPEQQAMHARLENWQRTVAVWHCAGRSIAMWANYRSHARQWHEPFIPEQTNTLDGLLIEVAVRQLPEKHRCAIRWSYVWRSSALHMARRLGVSMDGLERLVTGARMMLINRGV